MDPPPPSPFFIDGQVAEVTSQEPGFEGSWFIAMIIRKSAKKSNKFIVEYESLIDEQGLKPLKEYVHLKNIRPLQPQQPPRLFQEKEEVDAFHNDGWWKGIVAKVLEDSQYLVEFQCSDEALIFKQSDLRTHLEWINGKWVNLANQDQEMAERVEVKLDDIACAGAWFPATLLKKISDNSFLVEYKRSSFGNAIKHWRGIVDSTNVRPLRPTSPTLHKETFDLLEKVGAFYNFGWLNGVITKVLPDQKYVVFFKHRNEEREFRRSDLRLHMNWINSKWFLDKKEVTVVELNEGNGNFPNPTGSPSCSTVMDAQLTPSVVIEKSLGKVTSSSRNDAGRVDYDTTVGEADSPCDPVFSSQKDTEQSIPKGNNDFLGPPKKLGGQMSIRACSERGISTGSCNDVEADFMFSSPSPSPKGRRSKIEIRRARNSFSSELFFNSSGSPTGGNHVSMEIGEEKPKDDVESKSSDIKVSTACSHLNLDIMDVEPSVVLSSPQSNTQCLEEQKVDLPTKQMKETSTPLQEEDRVNTQSGITVKRKRGRPKGSGKKKKANTSSSPNFRIISPLQGSEKESSSTKNSNVQTQCSELPTSSPAENAKTQCSELPCSTIDETQRSELPSLDVTNHQMPSVHLERSGTSAVGNTGTETEAANRNLIDEFYIEETENTKLDADQTPNLVPEMSNDPTNEIGLESESACTENIAVGTVLEFVCPPILSSTIEERQTPSPTPDHANQASESKADMDVTNGGINQAQMLCPSNLENPLIVENNEDIQVALDETDETMDETPLDSVMDTQQPLIDPQNSPPPLAHEEQPIQLFEKKSAMWELLDELEVFKSNPQTPHFLPLENEPAEFREGKAFGYMCVFEGLVNNTNNASVEEERHVFENRLGALNELEEHGFKVSSMRWKLAKMIEIKDKLDEVGNRPDSSKLEIEEAENELKDLRRQLETLLAREERASLNLARLRRLSDEAEERARQLRLEFSHVASAP